MANLLIVDDELSMRQFLTHLFQREGHSVRVAENGREAMSLLRRQPADVAISDVKMPDLGGIELLRAARELQPDIEFIMMTAFANVDTAREAFLLGAFDFIQKPFDNDLLKEIVARALAKIDLLKKTRALQDENEALIKGQRARGKLGNILPSLILELRINLLSPARGSRGGAASSSSGGSNPLLDPLFYPIEPRSAGSNRVSYQSPYAIEPLPSPFAVRRTN